MLKGRARLCPCNTIQMISDGEMCLQSQFAALPLCPPTPPWSGARCVCGCACMCVWEKDLFVLTRVGQKKLCNGRVVSFNSTHGCEFT